MKIEVAVLADYASISVDGKMSVAGIFEAINAHAFPAMHPVLFLALRLRLEYEDGAKTHKVAVSLRDEDAREFFRGEGTIVAEKIPAGEAKRMNQIMNFVGLQFAQPGRYFFHVLWNGEDVERVSLDVRGPQ